ncbi:hypothetical protein NR798_06215 [Archangium gephyra]|uniref:hypothetical protein n=1 Tax=Archangium gephyra TaxID=48 RepID=UPI0035D51952
MNDRTGGLGRARLERLIAGAMTAPSGDNCQPWTFRWTGQELAIRYDQERGQHRVNHGRHAAYLSLGCVLEALSLAASAEELRSEETLHLEDPGAGTWATVRFRAGAVPDALAGTLAQRCTDRRLYRRGSISPATLQALREEAGGVQDSSLHVLERLPGELLAYCAKADSFVWREATAYRDVMRWIRFSPEEVERTRDGIAWRALGPWVPTVPGLRLARSPAARELVERLRLYTVSSLWARAQLESAAALLCLTVHSLERSALVSAGRRMLRSWLRLNQAGYAVQPFALPALPVYMVRAGGLPDGTRPEFEALFREGHGVLSRAFGLAGPELPVMLLRTGVAPPLPRELRALRRTVPQVFEWAGPS